MYDAMVPDVGPGEVPTVCSPQAGTPVLALNLQRERRGGGLDPTPRGVTHGYVINRLTNSVFSPIPSITHAVSVSTYSSHMYFTCATDPL